MNPKARAELFGVGALVIGLFLGLTLLPWHLTGGLGEHLGSFCRQSLGAGAVLLPVLGVGWALAAFGRLGPLSTPRAAGLVAGLVLLVPYAIGVVGRVDLAFPADYLRWTASQQLVGLIPGWLASVAVRAVGTAGGILVGLFAFSALGILTVGWHPLAILRAGEGEEPQEAGRAKRSPARPMKPVAPFEEDAVPAASAVAATARAGPRDAVAERPEKPRRPKPQLSPRAPAAPLPEGVLIPPPELLTAPTSEDLDPGTEEIEAMGQRLVQTLETFHVGGRIADRTVGPVVTQYEVEPGPGIKVGRIASLADDLALAMKARSLRIVAPIPGKAAVGIEVPNPTPRMVTIRELRRQCRSSARTAVSLPVALGRDLEGQAVVDDLAKMPHLLIAGATGSGKSVCINTIITSLIYSHPPDRLRC